MKTWTKEDNKILTNLVDRGTSINYICKMLNTSAVDVTHQMKRMDLVSKHSKELLNKGLIETYYNSGKDASFIAKTLNLPIVYVNAKIRIINSEPKIKITREVMVKAGKNKGNPYTTQDEAFILNGKQNKMSDAEIGKQLGRSAVSISVKYQELKKKLPMSKLIEPIKIDSTLSPQQQILAVKLWGEGKNKTTIAELINVTLQVLENFWNKLVGIPAAEYRFRGKVEGMYSKGSDLSTIITELEADPQRVFEIVENMQHPKVSSVPTPVLKRTEKKVVDYVSWTTLEDQILTDLTKEGKSPEEVATALGRTPHSVRGRIYRKEQSAARLPRVAKKETPIIPLIPKPIEEKEMKKEYQNILDQADEPSILETLASSEPEKPVINSVFQTNVFHTPIVLYANGQDASQFIENLSKIDRELIIHL